jgi:hypothetical protein
MLTAIYSKAGDVNCDIERLVNQIINVLQSGSQFDMEDFLWIIVKLWNRAVDYFVAHDLSNAKFYGDLTLKLVPYCEECPQIQKVFIF